MEENILESGSPQEGRKGNPSYVKVMGASPRVDRARARKNPVPKPAWPNKNSNQRRAFRRAFNFNKSDKLSSFPKNSSKFTDREIEELEAKGKNRSEEYIPEESPKTTAIKAHNKYAKSQRRLAAVSYGNNKSASPVQIAKLTSNVVRTGGKMLKASSDARKASTPVAWKSSRFDKIKESCLSIPSVKINPNSEEGGLDSGKIRQMKNAKSKKAIREFVQKFFDKAIYEGSGRTNNRGYKIKGTGYVGRSYGSSAAQHSGTVSRLTDRTPSEIAKVDSQEKRYRDEKNAKLLAKFKAASSPLRPISSEYEPDGKEISERTYSNEPKRFSKLLARRSSGRRLEKAKSKRSYRIDAKAGIMNEYQPPENSNATNEAWKELPKNWKPKQAKLDANDREAENQGKAIAGMRDVRPTILGRRISKETRKQDGAQKTADKRSADHAIADTKAAIAKHVVPGPRSLKQQ